MRELRKYTVTWSIDVEAGSPIEAADIALDVQRDTASAASVFVVFDDESGTSTRVNLLRNTARDITHGTSLARGLAQSAAGETRDLGDFRQYLMPAKFDDESATIEYP